jgi:hypothetical protein
MRVTSPTILALGISCVWACSGPELVRTSDDAEAAAPTSPEAEAAEAPVQPWKASSTGLVVEITESWRVSSGFEATREQLREEQLEALRGIRPRSAEADSVPCADCDQYRVSITDADGSVALYSIHESQDAQQPLDAVLDPDTLQPFLDTFACYGSSFNPFSPSRDPGPQQWESAPVLSTLDAGCSHGILHYAAEDMRFWLSVEAPGAYRVSAADCAPDLSLELLGSDLSVLASAASAAGECPVITYEFAQPGTYGLLLHRAAASGSAAEPPPSSYYRLQVAGELL